MKIMLRPGCDIVSVVVTRADHPGKTKVTELHHSVLRYQDVLRLHVPDDDDDDDNDVDDDDDNDDVDDVYDDDNLCRQL